LVELTPFLNQALRPVRQVSFGHLQGLDSEDTVEFALDRMEVRDTMLLEVHLDDNAVESGDDRHTSPLSSEQ
jgi:hypothetical protein